MKNVNMEEMFPYSFWYDHNQPKMLRLRKTIKKKYHVFHDFMNRCRLFSIK